MAFRRFKSFSRGFARKKGINKSGFVRRAAPSRKRKRGTSIEGLVRKVRRITKTIETKSGTQQISDNILFQHNNPNIISSTFMHTSNGTADVENSQGQRIGDKITLTGVSFKMMRELDENYIDVTLRLMVVRSEKGDTPSISTLWQGNSGNKMLDTFNTERYSILYTKYVKMMAPRMGNIASGVQIPGSGYEIGPSVLSRATKIVNFFVPGRKISKNGILQYENQSTQVKFLDFHFIMYAYSNYSTIDSGFVYNVARLNDCFIKLHYKDA